MGSRGEEDLTNTGELDKSLKAVAKGAGIIFVGMVIGKVLAMVNTILLARFLEPERYGLFSLGLTIVEILAIIGVFGLASGVTRFIPYYHIKNRDDKVKYTIRFSLKFSLILSAILATVLFLLSDQIACLVFKDDRLKVILQIFSIALPFYTINGIIPSIFRGFGNAKYRVLTEDIMSRIIKISAFILFVYFGYLLYGALAAFAVGTILTLGISLYLVQKKLFPIFGSNIKTKDVSVGGELLSFSWPLLIGSFSYIFYTQTDRILLGFFKTSEDIGIYTVGSQISHLLTFVVPSFAFLFLPVMSELYSKKKIHDFAHLYKSTTRWIFLITLPLFLFFLFFPEEIILLLFGSSYVSGATVLRILALAFFVSASVGLTWDTLLAMGKTKFVMITQGTGAVTNIALNVLLIPPFGIEGAAIGTACGIIIMNIMQLVVIHHSIKFHPYDRQYLKISVISILVMLLITTTIELFIEQIPCWSVLIIFPIYFVLYMAFVIKSKCLQHEDVMILKTIQEKTGIKLKFLDLLFK